MRLFVSRATRHDRLDLQEMLESEGWDVPDLTQGTAFIARDGKIAGCVRLIQVEPQTVVVEDVVVRSDKRGQGVGATLLQAAMNSRGGKLYLCCHDQHVGYYERFGFVEIPGDEMPSR